MNSRSIVEWAKSPPGITSGLIVGAYALAYQYLDRRFANEAAALPLAPTATRFESQLNDVTFGRDLERGFAREFRRIAAEICPDHEVHVLCTVKEKEKSDQKCHAFVSYAVSGGIVVDATIFIDPNRSKNTPDSVSHEAAHLVLATHLGVRPPPWIDEGLAAHFESKEQRELLGRNATAAKNGGRLFSVSALIAFPEPPSADYARFYEQSSSLVECMISLRGFQTFMQFTREAAASGNSEAALINHYGCSAAGLERDWKHSLEAVRN